MAHASNPNPEPLPVRERLRILFERLAALPAANSADEALAQIAATLKQVEDEFSGVPENPNPSKDFDGRMYFPKEDHIKRRKNGSIRAKHVDTSLISMQRVVSLYLNVL